MNEGYYPELEKMNKVSEKSHIIGEFLEWLNYEKKVQFCRFHEHNEECYEDGNEIPICGMSEGYLQIFHYDIESLLAEFFGIDMKKVEQERRALLEEFREEVEV